MNRLSYAFISAFSLLAVANPVPIGTSRYALNERDITVTEADISSLRFYAQYAAAAYCNSEVPVGSAITCYSDTCPDVTAANATVTKTFVGLLTDAKGFVSTDNKNKLIVVSVQGSESIRNWIADLTFVGLPCDLVSGCVLHTGFLTAYNEVKDALLAGVAAAKAANPSYKIVFTGHSLGGAVSTVAAGYARKLGYEVDLYTYGSPRVGNKQFVQFVTDQAGAEYRVTHLDDPVPRLPPLIVGYRHTSPEYWLADGSSDTTTYTAADTKVCEGHASVKCNGGTLGLDIEAHLNYFEPISGCSQDDLSFKRRDTDISDEDLTAKVNDWAEQDRAYAATLDE